MKHTKKVYIRIVCMMLSVVMLFGMVPTTAMASDFIDTPLNGVTGNGWDDFGELPGGYEDDYSPSVPDEDSSDSDKTMPNGDNSGADDSDGDKTDAATDGQGNNVAEPDAESTEIEESAVATPGNTTLGMSGIFIDLPPDVLADFIAFMENAKQAIESPYVPIRPMAGVGDTGTITWSWGEPANFDVGGYYVNQIPRINLSTANPPEGRPFCALFGPDPLTGGTYKAQEYSDSMILKLLIAHEKGSASAVGVQLAIWAITNDVPVFNDHAQAQAALSAANSVNTDGYTVLMWDTSGSYQPFFTLEQESDDTPNTLKILKQCAETDKLLKNAEFSVSGPGVNLTGLKTNNRGEIITNIPMPGGTYTVTETTPPPGYFPADPASQTVTINATNPTGTVTFKNMPDDPPEEEEGESSFRVEVEVEVETNVETFNEKEFEYSRAYGQFTIRKHDQDRKSLDGALFNIEVRFTDGTVLRENGWEVDNGARLFSYSHPENNHDPATITVREAQPPLHYTGDSSTKTVTVQPSYVRTIIQHSWTTTHWTYYYHYTVIEITPEGEEVTVETYDETREEFEVTAPIIESFPEHVPGDREITVTFVNVRERGQLIVTKKDANTGQPLAGADIQVKGVDLGNAGTYDMTLTTGANGEAVFNGLFPGSYSVQEIRPPFAYNLNNQVQAVTIQSNETVRREIHNTRQAGLFIKKVDQDGKPLAGATFELRTASGDMLHREVTDANGIIWRGYLPTAYYEVEEVKAPEGYLMDANNPQTIYINNNEYNKEFTLTFVNLKKPSIEIIKVDATTPTLKLEGAVFRITNVHTNQYWDVQTGKDGKALLEDLEIETAYIVEELSPAEGYVNSGYRQEIILREARVHTITVTNEQSPSLKIIKKDAKTGGRLAGATFRLAKEGGSNFHDVTTGQHGEVLVPDLAPGTYILTEIRAVEGYILNSTPQTVIIKQGEHTVVEVTNHKKSTLTLIKKDALTGKTLGGAIFRLAKDGGSDYRDVTTGSDGTVKISDIVPGTYILSEVKSPTGYLLNDEPMTVIIAEGENKIIELVNYKRPSLKIIKKDAETGDRLAGAIFRLAKEGGSTFQDVTTGQNGEVVAGDLTPGTYILTEIKAPSGYVLNDTPQTIIIQEGKQTVVEVTNHQKSTLTLVKKDALTGVLLEGAIFRFAKEGSSDYRDVTTGRDGTVKIGDIEPGTFILTEVKSPNGYLLNEEPMTVIIAEGEHKVIELVNYKRPSLEIIKKDKETGELLADATFRISWNNGADYQDVTTGADGKALVTGLDAGWHTVLETRAPEGYLLNKEPQQILLKPGEAGVIEIFNEKKPSLTILKVDNVTKTPLQYAKFRIERKTEDSVALVGEYISDEDGIVFLDNILPGRYLITEIEAPDGFNIDKEAHEVTIEYGKSYKLEFTNTAKSPIYIQKVDDKGNPLVGAKFKVTTMNGAMVGTVTSGRTGYAIIPYVEPGWYVVDEISAPDGFILSSTPVNVEVKSGRPAQVEFVNHKKPQLSILKLDESDKTALMGARIKVAKTNGEIIGTFTSDRNGLVILTDLEPGSYTVTEIAAPDGFILDSTPQIVELKPGETKQIELYNTSMPGLQLRKVDKLTNLPVGGARFSLVKLESGAKRDLGTFVTGENGLFYVPGLTPGDYVLTETMAAPGYILDSTPQSIYIEGGKLNTVEVFNIPYSSLRIVKISADDDGKPLPGAIFKLYNEKRLEIGTYETSALGEIMIPQLPAGEYYLQETKAPAGFILDSTVRKVELIGGKTTVVEVKNRELGSLRIIKRNKEDGKPLYGATFLLYDGKNNLLGEFTTDNNGLITFGRNLAAGTYKLKEIKAPDNFVLDDTIRSITVKEGETTEIVVENEPKRGRIQITKVSSGNNDLTKEKEGAALKGAKFELYDNKMKLVDTITTGGKNGLATSDYLPLGVYGIKEVSSPDYYFTDGEMFYAELKIHDDLVKFKVVNDPVHIETSVEKRGVVEAMAGSSIFYDITGVENKSNTPLEEFYLHDVLPTEAVRLEKIWTGVWSERVKMELQIKTNLKTSYRTVKKGMLSTTNNEIDCSRSALGLASNEYVTEFKLVFGTVQPEFHETTGLKVQVKVLDSVKNGTKFTNKVDVSGRYLKEWVYDTDGWTCVSYNTPNRGDLPKTGLN